MRTPEFRKSSAAALPAPPYQHIYGFTESPVWSKAPRALIALILVSLLLALVHGAVLLREISSSGDAGSDNRTWVIAQLEVDHKELRIALLEALESPPSNEFAEPAVRRAFDIYYSRVATVAASKPIMDGLDVAEGLEWIEASRDKMASIIDGVTLLGRNELRLLNAMLLNDTLKVRKFTSDALLRFSYLSEEERLQRSALLIRLGLLMGLLVVLMALAVVFAVRISRDATRKAQYCSQIATSLRRAFETSLDGVIVADGSGSITYLNAAAQDIFGINSSEFLGTSIAEMILPHESDAGDSTSLRRIAKGARPEDIVDTGRHRLVGVHRTGREFPLEISIASDYAGDGQLVFIGFVRDITEEMSIERSLREARDQAQLDASAKSRFLALMSHEMRTPLHGVLAALELVNTESLGAADLRYLATARACACSAVDQVDEVLELTQSGAVEVTISTFDARLLVSELIAGLNPLAAERGNRLIFAHDCSETQFRVSGWRRGFLLVLRNLISNAIKFTHNGQIQVDLTCSRQPDGNFVLDVKVSDTGLGIDQGDQERVFWEFETLGGGGRSEPGVGLGLAIARTAAERIGGQLCLDSVPGLGSQFYFRMPVEIAAVEDHACYSIKGRADATEVVPEAPISPLRILVVDDNHINLALLVEMLRRLGHLPESARDGRTAVTLATSSKFDLVLMDIGMPVMDGIEATEAIRKGGASACTPVIGVTALVLDNDRARMLDAGMHDVLVKPLGLDQLRERLTEFLADHVDVDQDDERFNEARELMGDSMMARLIGEVMRDAEAAFEELRGWNIGQMTAPLQRSLHRAAGSASVIGASGLSEVLRNGERCIRAANFHALDLCKADLELEMHRTAIKLQQFWKKNSLESSG